MGVKFCTTYACVITYHALRCVTSSTVSVQTLLRRGTTQEKQDGTRAMTTNQISVERSTSRFSLELPRLTHFINGQYTDSSSGGSFTVVDPARGEPITHIPLGGQQEVDQAVQAARTAAPAWGARTPS